jgi:hypothetical protein
MIKSFKILADSEHDFILKADSIRLYEELHKLKMRCSFLSATDRLQIAKEFNWKIAEFDTDLNLPQYVAQVALLLFRANPERPITPSDDFAPGEINRAERFFFQRANGVDQQP